MRAGDSPPAVRRKVEDPEKPKFTTIHSDNWTDDLPDTDHVNFFRELDWSTTYLGPLKNWDFSLRLHTHTVFADTRPSVVYWGPERVAIYNEAFLPLASDAHPGFMGAPFYKGFPEIWEEIKPVFLVAEESRKAVDMDELQLFVNRNNCLEETYFDGNTIPLRGDSGEVEGFYSAVHEITHQRLHNRRTEMLNRIAAAPPDLDNKTVGDHVMTAFKSNERDVTMAMLYQADEDTTPGTCALSLSGLLGMPPDHRLAISNTNLESPDGLIPHLREARNLGSVTMPVDARFEGIAWLGFGEASKHINITTLSSGARLWGFIVIGLNPRRELDEVAQQFVRDLSRQLSATVASVVSIENSRQRQLRLQEELAESERQIRHLAQHSSVAMQQITVEGEMIWANDEYYALTGHPRNDFVPFSFIDVLLEEDQAPAREKWNSLSRGGGHVSIELRLKRTFTPPTGDPEPAWMLAIAFPFIEEGKVKCIMSTMSDISRVKWAERNAQAATEAKKRTESFIDVVSHEMRNPMSAIYHLAESITSSLEQCQTSASVNDCFKIISGNVDAAKQILICANHQKTIVDDILTLSRLESQMLSIAPVPSQLTRLVDSVAGMFQAEYVTHKIEMSVVPEPSIKEHKIDYILCDPSRLAQIIVNLLTNAIKFTKAEKRRSITLSYGVSASNPRQAFSKDMYWPPSNERLKPLKFDQQMNAGEGLFLLFSLVDTGIGMHESDIHHLFEKFAQASVRTHVQYGGSGLGLFISRQLAVAHGGALGVASKPGQGSTFAVYIEARRAVSPENLLGTSPGGHAAPVTPTQQLVEDDRPAAKLRQLYVLVVEDNLVNQQVLAKQLRRKGFQVYVANNGVEALDMVRSSNLWHAHDVRSKAIDIVLMDIEMPILNGLDATRQIRDMQQRHEITRHLQIVGITANARAEQIASALDAGMDAVLPKPFLVADLMAMILERVKTS